MSQKRNFKNTIRDNPHIWRAEGVIHAVKYAKALSRRRLCRLCMLDQEETKRIQDKWQEYGMGVPLIVLESPYRSIIKAVPRFPGRSACEI